MYRSSETPSPIDRHDSRNPASALKGEPIWLSTEDLAKEFPLCKSSWAKLRMTGRGPAFIKAGRRVFYRRGDVEAWLNARVRHSTSEYVT